MNKETRTFIWGLMLFIVCGLGLTIDIVKLKNGTFDNNQSVFDWAISISCLLGTLTGAEKIFKTTN